MADLVAAGAPVLPEGWFYRLTTSGPICGWPTVEIRQPGRWFGSRVVSYSLVRTEEHDEHLRKTSEALALRGDHDPKGGR
jgi:hypothetical protein